MPSPKYFTDPISSTLDIIDYADRNQKKDLRSYIASRFDNLIKNIEACDNFPDRNLSISKLKDYKDTFVVEANGAASYTPQQIREELKRIKPYVETLEVGVDDKLGYAQSKSLINGPTIKERKDEIFKWTQSVYDDAEAQKSDIAGKALFFSDNPITQRIAQLGLYEAVYGLAEQQKSLAQAVTQAKGHTSSLNNVAVLDTSGNKGAPLNGQANPDQDKTRVVANGKQ